MKIGLLNLEPKYKNLAIEKLRLYHMNLGNTVEDYMPLAYESYDKIYCSSIFTFTPKRNLPPNAICGGTGFDLITKLPSEIEAINPHLNFGFTTRGCIRVCPFCVVHIKEGHKVVIVAKLKDIWNGVKGAIITLYDNNILALVDHFFSICAESKEYHVKLDINQGLDHRLLNQAICQELASISHAEYHFAFDSPAYYKSVDKAIKLLQENRINRSIWYVLVGYDTSFQEDLDRLNFLRDRGQNAYVQRYVRKPEYIPLARWANQHHIFQGMTWEQFLNHPKNKHRNLEV